MQGEGHSEQGEKRGTTKHTKRTKKDKREGALALERVRPLQPLSFVSPLLSPFLLCLRLLSCFSCVSWLTLFFRDSPPAQPPVRDRRCEQHRVHHVEHAAEAGDGLRGVL